MDLKYLVKDTTSRISHCISGVIYYIIKVGNEEYIFPIDMNDRDDVGTATFPAEIKTITLMRYVRKAIDNNSLIKIK